MLMLSASEKLLDVGSKSFIEVNELLKKNIFGHSTFARFSLRVRSSTHKKNTIIPIIKKSK